MKDELIKKLWHTNRKCFIEQFSILQTINSVSNYEHTYFEYNPKTQELERLSTCQIKEIQCTGLKDKNGKLIYEGDVVDIISEVETIGVIKWSDDLARFVIVYENVQCDFGNYWNYELEVIGNIFENPKLIEEAQ